MTTAREIMTPSPRCIGVNDSLRIAASVMADLNVGALPICGEDSKLKGMLTDRDIVMSVVAADVPAATLTVGDIMTSPALTCGEDHHLLEIISVMRTKAIRRLPVVNAHGVLAGMVTADDVYLALGVLLHEMNAAITDEQTREHELRV